MPDPAPILDYASPHRRRRLAIPAETRIDLRARPDAVTVTAVMRGREGAVGGILFACLILVIYGAFIVGAWKLRSSAVAIILLFWLSYASLLAIVVRNTWRRTVLTADPQVMKLSFSTPWSAKHYEWTADQIAQIDVVPVLLVSERPHGAGEPLITIRHGSPLRLFGGHPAELLLEIATELRRVLSSPPPGLR